MREVAGEFVFNPQLFFLQAVEKVFVRMRSMLFLVDQRVKRRMLRFESFDLCLVHGCHSFRISE